MQKLFSGVQPSGNLHIGNYLGAVKQWVTLQEQAESIFCVVDLHAITVPQDPEVLRKKTLEIAKIYLASGIDPTKSTLFVQSHVAAHSELAWILNTVARMGDLDKMTQYKDKSQKEGETTSIGLYDYPVLMAADILLYDTEVVPVGDDQLQHIELARTLARRFNERFGETFVVPEGRIQKEGARIMGLDDPTKKMSKSAPSEYNYISLTDDEATVLRKIKKAVTDSGTDITYSDDLSDAEASRPALRNLINIYSLFSRKTPGEIVEMYAGKGYGDFKVDLAAVISGFLTPFQERLASISDEEVKAILEAGAVKARAQAEAKMKQVRERVGLL
ncbi:MAG: tryptophan--tRNA ligase [Candidatus Moranbacteria bacterium]|nr:tryptophan--tRNA ligase [Candidatus Moranbacteria bacterium]